MKDFDTLKHLLTLCINSGDVDLQHQNADLLLKDIALNTEFALDERIELIAIYNQIEKWYS